MRESSNGNLNIGEWIKDHSYAILLAVVIIAVDYGVMTVRLDVIEKNIDHIQVSVKDNEKNIDQMKLDYAGSNAKIIQVLHDIDKKIDRFQIKFDKYDEDIRLFYEKYHFNAKDN